MYYSLIPILSLILVVIINYGLFINRENDKKSHYLRSYKICVLSLVFFFIFDLLWGIFYSLGLSLAVYIDTALYFAAMSLSVLAWTCFVTLYLHEKGVPGKIIVSLGFVFSICGVVAIIVNFFYPILFSFDANTYVPAVGRYIYLGAQILMFLLTSGYGFIMSFHKKPNLRTRFVAIGIFGLSVSVCIFLQIFNPLLPLYALGCAIGITIIRSFVLTSQNLQFRHEIEEGINRENLQKQELGFVKELAYTDPLTGCKSKHAYVEDEETFDTLIRDGKMDDFAIVVCDLNDLKLTNDTKGHDAGDNLLIESAVMIRKGFPDSACYRYGGDEFAIILTGEAYKNRQEILKSFNELNAKNLGSEKPVLASGMSDFRKGEDNTFSAVFSRADENMYWHKRKLKQASNAKNGVRNDIYEMFYRSKDCSLVEMLNNSSCDEIVEVDLNHDSFRQFYYIENKYISAPMIKSYSALYEFCCNELVHPDDKEEYAYQLNPDRFFQRISKNRIPNFDFIHVRYKLEDGSYRYVEQCVIAGEENELAPGVFRIYIFDIHNLKMRMAGNETGNIKPFMKQRNSLTGLYVENEFFSHGESLVKEKGGDDLCLISIDIEHFRFFDEWYGREKGDEFLAGIGKILLKEEEETGGVAGYFAYDDFAIICPKNDKRILALYEKIRGLVGEFGLSVGFQPAFGITKLEEGVRVVDAFDRANIALGRAKKDIRSRICYYESSARDEEEAEYRVLSDFVDAMKNDEFTFYLQPQCIISSGKIVGSEALVRWKKKSGKIIPPGDYIPLLEKYGFIVDLDQMLWGKVAKWLRQLIDEGITPLPVSVNVSRADIFSLDIASIFKNLARKYNLPHELLKIEITESAYSETTTKMADLAKKLRNDGFMVLMDDFGSGYSSLNMLNTLEVDVIKLDGGFLRLKGSAYDRGISIIESVVNMSRNIALPIIVEGVETKSQSDFLQSLGCHYVQGYYFYRPMPIKDFEALLKNEDGLDRNGIVASSNEQFRLHEFLDENIYSDSMLNNIIGPVAFYALKADGDVDIVRFNEQFCDAVGIKEFHERLGAVQNYMPKEDAVILRKALAEAISDRLVGSNAVLRFYKPEGTISYFKIHFYYIGKKENNDLFYGSATDVSPLAILKEEFDIISHMSKDSLILISKKYDKWVYRVASHGLSNALGLSPEQLEKELNNGFFAKRVSRKEDLAGFMKIAAEKSDKHENFEAFFHVRPKTGKSVLLKLEFFYVGDRSDNVLYVLRSSVADSPKSA